MESVIPTFRTIANTSPYYSSGQLYLLLTLVTPFQGASKHTRSIMGVLQGNVAIYHQTNPVSAHEFCHGSFVSRVQETCQCPRTHRDRRTKLFEPRWDDGVYYLLPRGGHENVESLGASGSEGAGAKCHSALQS